MLTLLQLQMRWTAAKSLGTLIPDVSLLGDVKLERRAIEELTCISSYPVTLSHTEFTYIPSLFCLIDNIPVKNQ
jgi:hypothetical protein